MDRRGRKTLTGCLAACVVMLLAGSPARAQFNLDDAFKIDAGKSLLGAAEAPADAEVSATLTPDPAKPGEAELRITITLPDGVKTYGQDPSAQKKTEIRVADVPGAIALGEGFTVDRAPKIAFEEVLKKDVGSYSGSVTFSRRYRIEAKSGAEPTLEGKVSFLICSSQACTPLEKTFVAPFSGLEAVSAVPTPQEVDPAAASQETLTDAPAFQSERAHSLQFAYRVVPTRKQGGKPVDDPIRLQFELAPANAKPGEEVTVAVTMELDEHWHTYALQKGENQAEVPTEISFDTLAGLTKAGELSESPTALVKDFGDRRTRYHDNLVTWKMTFRRTESPTFGVAGQITYQICEEAKQCKNPKPFAFELGSVQTAETIASAKPVTTSYVDTPDVPFNVKIAGGNTDHTLAGILVLAFFGGLLMNIMPCVLPVLAIKILSFVQQAGQSRGRVMALNLSYTAGVLTIFWLLASLAVFANASAGDIFQLPWFTVAIVVLLFVVGLNLLGVFEFSVPGIIGSAAGGGHREGLPGAYMTGVFTTLLATPCTIGPITSVFAWSLTQPAGYVYLVFAMLAVGMAFPYLFLGLFPKLVDRCLPRPGMWMVRFKQLCAFAMFGAAIFFVGGVDKRDLLPLLTGLLGISLGLWMIGQMYDRETPIRRKNWIRGWALGLTIATCGLGWQMHREATMKLAHHLPWEKFSSERFIQLRKDGRPAIVDFTAEWCGICKTNEAIALNTLDIANFVKERNVTTLMADWTHYDAEITEWLDRFKVPSVPLTVIIPADPKQDLIVLNGLFTKGQLLERLNEAVPAKPAAGVEAEAVAVPPARTAMTGAGGD